MGLGRVHLDILSPEWASLHRKYWNESVPLGLLRCGQAVGLPLGKEKIQW